MNKTFLTLMGVALLVGGCGNRTASTQDAAQTDTILAEEVPDTVQTLSQEPSQTLPDGAVKADEINGLFVFTKLVQKSSEDDPADIRSLWLYERKTGRVDSLLTTNPFAEQRWAEMSDGPVEVALTQIAAALWRLLSLRLPLLTRCVSYQATHSCFLSKVVLTPGTYGPISLTWRKRQPVSSPLRKASSGSQPQATP